jgi:serine phosphatase RsbU (regulator of sigma subunit)
MSGGLLEWGWAGMGLERESGDLHVVAEFPGGALVALIDGLGHGPEAALAAREAARVLEERPRDPLDELIRRCHDALHGTRGAVMSVASFDAQQSSMTWAGVGNVEALLLRADRSAERRREVISLRGGVVGYQLPPIRASTLAVGPGDTLVMASDGLRSGFATGIPLHWGPQALADSLLERHARGSDDALVVVARYLGPRP